MPAVTVIGLGPMGSAIASTLVAGGHDVTVWNRTPARAHALIEQGARPADSVADAVASSPTVICSLPSYRITNDLIATPEVQSAISGRTLVQLSTGSARQAREMAGWAAEHGAGFLSGSVMGYPRGLGTPEMSIILSGDPATYDTCEPVILTLAPAARRASDEPGGSSTIASALWNFYYGAYGAFLETGALAEAAGAAIADFGALATSMLDVVRDGIEDTARRVESGELGGEQATIDAIQRDLEGGRRLYESHGVEPRFTSAFLSYLVKAQAAGDGGKDPAAAFHHVRSAEQPD
jgi:3-hydroxyisobutyrate dehydrogenase-like beta-hydroxyacid dehydrogenase